MALSFYRLKEDNTDFSYARKRQYILVVMSLYILVTEFPMSVAYRLFAYFKKPLRFHFLSKLRKIYFGESLIQSAFI